MTELKPCPFCGGEAKLSGRESYEKSAKVECPHCGAKIFKRDFTSTAAADECVRVWNNRPNVQETKHGKWEIMPHSLLSNRCSSCGAVYETPEAWNYCPNCGTKMDDKPDLSDVATRLRKQQMKNICYFVISEDMRFVRVDYVIICKRYEDESSPKIKIKGTNLGLEVYEPTEVIERQGIVISQITHEISELFCDTALIAIHGIVRDKSDLFSQEITYDLTTGEIIDCFAPKPTDLYYKLKEREPNA
jgi:DNA-directed RNA polymerase subunit RPC12/RpoP